MWETKAVKPLRRVGWVARAGTGVRSRGLGHQEAFTPVETALHTRGCVGSPGGRRALGRGATLSVCVRPHPRRVKGESVLAPGARGCARGQEGGCPEGPGLLPTGRERLPVPPRPLALTFTKLSASGNPGNTISSSDLAALIADGALDSAGLGGAIFSACMALLARVSRPARLARITHVQSGFRGR